MDPVRPEIYNSAGAQDRVLPVWIFSKKHPQLAPSSSFSVCRSAEHGRLAYFRGSQIGQDGRSASMCGVSEAERDSETWVTMCHGRDTSPSLLEEAETSG